MFLLWWSSNNNVCKLCTYIPNCTTSCDESGLCTECKTGYHISNGTCELCTSIPGCSECNQQGTCTVCLPNHYHINVGCKLCTDIEGCNACDESNGSCTDCENTYFKFENIS